MKSYRKLWTGALIVIAGGIMIRYAWVVSANNAAVFLMIGGLALFLVLSCVHIFAMALIFRRSLPYVRE